MRADRDSVRRKLKIARGQLDGILQMIDDDRYCVDISNQLLATQSLLKSANQQIMRAHIEGCVREALQTDHLDPKLEEAFQLLERMAQSEDAKKDRQEKAPPAEGHQPNTVHEQSTRPPDNFRWPRFALYRLMPLICPDRHGTGRSRSGHGCRCC